MLKGKQKSVRKGWKQVRWTFNLFDQYTARIIGYALLKVIKTVIDLALTYIWF